MHSACRFLIVVFDSLRPDRLSPTRTPHLHEFCRRGTVFTESHAVFPTLTRVNKVSLATGTVPAHHGILFNSFYDPELLRDRIIDIGDMAMVLAADSGGQRLITAATIGEILSRAGRRLAVVHTGKPGAPWLLDYRGSRLGHVHFSIHGPRYSTPLDLATQIVDRLGAIPDSRFPDLPRIDYAVTAFLDIIYPRTRPDVSILWLDEPDHTSHDHDPGATVLGDAVGGVDAVFGRILDWWEREGRRDGVQIVAMSDHGCIPGHTRIDVCALLNRAGFAVQKRPPGEPGLLLLPGSVGGVYLHPSRKRLLPELTAWMQAQEWCGHLFTEGSDEEGDIPGTFSHAMIGIAHRRAPDLVYTLRSRPDGGGCFYDSGKPVLSAQHGGLNPMELRNLLAFGGAAFAEGYRSPAPAGIVDVVPTVLDLMGLPRPPTMTGRPLREAYASGPLEPESGSTRVRTTDAGDYRQSLRVWEQGAGRYIDAGWIG